MVVNVRNPSPVAKGFQTYRPPTFAVLVADVRNLNLITEGFEIWHPTSFAMTMA